MVEQFIFMEMWSCQPVQQYLEQTHVLAQIVQVPIGNNTHNSSYLFNKEQITVKWKKN